jgi:hypothetical protein
MEHIDPLDLVKNINLRCFGEVCQEKLGSSDKCVPSHRETA